MRIKHLPVGNIPLLLSACDESTNTTEYDGGDVPIFARVDDDGHRFYKCKHVMQEADTKKGRKIAICNSIFHDSNSSNIGSIISHCKSRHWNVKKKKTAAHQKSSLFSFGGFSNKKQKTETAPPIAAPTDEQVNANVAKLDHQSDTTVAASLDDVRATESVLSEGENVATSDTTSDDRHNMSNSVDKADLAEKSGDVVEEIVMESCKGIKFTDVNNVEFNSEYEFVLMYPFNIHATSVQQSYSESNFLPTVTWSADTSGYLISNKCTPLYSRNLSKPNNANTTRSGGTACVECVRLQFNQNLHKVMSKSASNDYGTLPNALCPTSVFQVRYHNHRNERAQLRHTLCNQNRKILSLSRNVDDYSRLMLLMQENDIPSIKRLEHMP
mmetsp:Transcript_16251/g.32816  ORF Transcript_16251/g.32816 Transcript_16251/m.32816 type:complete len:384 (+) Transcript_16251:232-1383(+)